jgi:hypothetical protein
MQRKLSASRSCRILSARRSFARERMVVKSVAAPAIGALFGLGLLACSAGSNSDLVGGSGGQGSTENGGNTQSNGSGANGPSAGTFAGSGGGGSQSGGVGGGCAGTSVAAQKIPLDMYIMLDQSGSMTDPVGGGGDKWDAVTGALNAFIQQPTAAGLGVGIQYFGLPGATQVCPASCAVDTDCSTCGGTCVPFFAFCSGAAGGDSCTAADYATPEVEISSLPGVAQAIHNSIAAHSPSTDTPTSAALQGAVDHAKAWQTSHPEHVVVAVLATDGDPTECDTDLSHIDAIAAAGANGTPKVRTFVIGVGSSLGALNGIAAAGGTGQAFVVDTTMNTNAQFLAALNAIQGTSLACSYSIPVPMSGTPNYQEVNVQYTPGGGGAPILIPNVSSAAQCPATGDAWYYDNNTTPTQIILCGSSCDKVKVDTMGKIDIVLGCSTVPA